MKKWQIRSQPDANEIASVADQWNINPVVAQILLSRHISGDNLRTFLGSGLSVAHNPFDMRGMDAAVSTIEEAIRTGRKMAIYGDYDADGTTATSVLYNYFTRVRKADVDYFIPMRNEGYGIKKPSLDTIKQTINPELIISVDCGTNSAREVEYAQSLGMRFVVTDHHQPETGKIVKGIVLNPHLTDAGYPFNGLAGVGVAYKLVCAMMGKHPDSVLDLVAIGTVGDMMPLLDENRIIVQQGLNKIEEGRRVGLVALMKTIGLKRSVTATDIGFKIAPRINAISRMGLNPMMVVELLTTDNPTRATELADILNNKNRERQTVSRGFDALADEQINPQDNVIVVSLDIPVGLAGLVASHITNKYNRPSLVMDLTGHGSGRGIPGVSIINILNEYRSFIGNFGGHHGACGLSGVSNITQFREAIRNHPIDAELLVPSITADLELDLSQVNPDLYASLMRLEPFGQENPAPLFFSRKLRIEDKRLMGADKTHFSFGVVDPSSGQKMRGIMFGGAENINLDHADLLYEISPDDYRGGLQLMVKAMREPGPIRRA